MAEGFCNKANEPTVNVSHGIYEWWYLEESKTTETEKQVEQPNIENTQASRISHFAEENRTFQESAKPIPVPTTTTDVRASPSPKDVNAEKCLVTDDHSGHESRKTGVKIPPGFYAGDVKSTPPCSDKETVCLDGLPGVIPPNRKRAYCEPSLLYEDFEKFVADDPDGHELDPCFKDLPLHPIEIANALFDVGSAAMKIRSLRSISPVRYSDIWWNDSRPIYQFLPPYGPQPEAYDPTQRNAQSDITPDIFEFDRLLKSLLDSHVKPYPWLLKGKMKHYTMFKTRKKVFTETENNLKDKNLEESIMGVSHETHKIFEGPSEIPLMQPPEGTKRNESQSNNYKRQPSDVEADGSVSDLVGDPPGQQSVYIPPGDNRREAYRLSTFEQFPNKVINAAILARHGFVYTGFYDRVKCFSCGRTVEKWEAVDNPSDRKWHKTDCLFVRGHPTGNIPLGGRFSESFSTLVNSNVSQPMDVTPSYMPQASNGPFTRNPVDIPDLQRGGTYQMRPGSTFVIGSGGQPSRQTAPASQPPATSRPNNPPRGWRMANVISADHKRHLTNLYLNREMDRVASFGRWPTGRPNVSPVSLARAGFFYLGDMDRTQCFSCGGVLRNWNVEDDAMAEHSMHFPNCRFVVGVERRNVPISERPESPRELGDHYPCRFPMNPHMRSEQSRLQTFDRRWPLHKTRAKPEEIAEAGFFFLGENDRVKCWYCNGGLQNWEYDDIPWAEHSKWFPNCQFLLAKKGQLFVYQHLSMNPQLPRPIIGRQDGATVDPSTATPHSSQSPRTQDVPPSVSRARAPSPPPAIIDPQEELRKRRERVDNEMQSDTVKVVITMGYDESLVKRTLMDQLESGTAHDNNNIFEGTASLLDAVMKKEEEVRTEQEEERSTSIKFPTVSSNYSAVTMGSMDTSTSMPQTSGVYNVSGFGQESDDEDRDLYSSIADTTPSQPMSVGFVNGATNAPPPTSVDSEAGARLSSHIWNDIPQDPESIKDFIEQKKEESLCKICFTETADMLFIPCSHMCCCKTCTEAIRNCPVCRKKIEKAIKTYIK